MPYRTKNVVLLTLAGALALSTAPLVVFVGGLVGAMLAPTAALATLPVALLVVGTASAVMPVAWSMQRFGRKSVFLASAGFSMLGAIAAAYAISKQSFMLFNLAVVVLGAGLAVVQQFRFAAMESVAVSQHSQAASFVLLGGLVAAFLGPEVGTIGRNWLAAEYGGSFLLLAGVLALSIPVLMAYTPNPAQTENRLTNTNARPLKEIAKQHVFWVAIGAGAIGYAVMSFVMTATPISMHHEIGHSIEDTKWVIQTHIMAMYLPSFFSGKLIQKFGHKWLMIAGVIAFVFSIVIAYSGAALSHFYSSLILLGVGWNFLFVSGTSLLPHAYRESERFHVQGLNDFSVFGLQAIAALSSGIVVFQFGWGVLLLLALPILLIQIMLLVSWSPNKPQDSQQAHG
jgi:MFS family permease